MEEIISLTMDLIQFKSTASNPGETIKCADYLSGYLESNGLHCTRLEYEGVPSILALPEDNWAPVLLMSHMDVVPAPDELFAPHIADQKLYGRGSLDDKYAVALSLVLLKEFFHGLQKEGKTQKDLPFGILITGDEETGGYHGAQKVLAKTKTDFCIALDGGGPRKIVVKEKGILRVKLLSRGKTAHGARPWLGENAIYKLMTDCERIKRFFDRETPDHWHRTLNFGLIKGGEAVNQVPEYAEAVFDIRYTEEDDIEDLIGQMQSSIRGEMIVEKKEPLFRGGRSPYTDLLLEAAENAETGFEHGASDARFLREYNMDGVVWGADGDQSQHSRDEHVNIDSVIALYHMLEAFIKRIGSRDV